MNDIRRTILWVIFGFSLVLLWDQWQIHNGNKATFFPPPPSKTASATAPADVPHAVVSQGAATVPVKEVAKANKELVTVQTDVLKVSFDTEGATVARVEFLKHADDAHAGQNVVLLDESADRVYVAQTGLLSATPGTSWPTHKTMMTVRPGSRELKEGQDLHLQAWRLRRGC